MGELFHPLAIGDRLVAAEERYSEFLRRPPLSAGVYRLAAGERDLQSPHTEDEIYLVVSGQAVLRAGGVDLPVELGSIVFVAAGEDHRFHSITEDLVVVVVFGPAEGTAGR